MNPKLTLTTKSALIDPSTFQAVSTIVESQTLGAQFNASLPLKLV